MMDLLATLRVPGTDCRESAVAWFVTATPWVAPAAYLHIIYKPAPEGDLAAAADRWEFPADVVSLLARHNGLIAFSGAFSVFGVVRSGQLLDRSSPFSLPPYDIEIENDAWRGDQDLVVIGGYSEDGSRVCVSRSCSRLMVVPAGGGEPLAVFESLGAWLTTEVARYKELFDSSGRLVGRSSDLGPPRGRSGAQPC